MGNKSHQIAGLTISKNLPKTFQALTSIKKRFRQTAYQLRSLLRPQLAAEQATQIIDGVKYVQLRYPKGIETDPLEGWKQAEKQTQKLEEIVDQYSSTLTSLGALALLAARNPGDETDSLATRNSIDKEGGLTTLATRNPGDRTVRFCEDVKEAAPESTPTRRAMNPTELNDRQERILHVEEVRTLLRDICFNKILSDKLHPAKLHSVFPNREESRISKALYKTMENRKEKQREINTALRWVLMSRLWPMLNAILPGKRNKALNANDLREVNSKMMAAISPFLESASYNDTQRIKDSVFSLIASACDLRQELTKDPHAVFYFITPTVQDSCARLRYKSHVDVVMLSGAEHNDDSRDVAEAVCFGALVQRKRARPYTGRLLYETNAWVTGYRPEVDEVTRAEEMANRYPRGMEPAPLMVDDEGDWMDKSMELSKAEEAVVCARRPERRGRSANRVRLDLDS